MTAHKILPAMRIYDILWRLCLPLLKRNARLADGYQNRRDGNHLTPADIWIQAASAGEAYLALSLIENLSLPFPVHVLVTTNTRQGLDIIQTGIKSMVGSRRVTAECGFIPFDRPAVMTRAVHRVSPKLMILLETEIWPGLLFALKNNRITTVIINGRLTPGSLRRYMVWPGLWKALAPDRILAISGEDAERFAALFGPGNVQKMPNIKFDRLATSFNTAGNDGVLRLKALIPDTIPFLVLGSVRQPEEAQVTEIIRQVLANVPETVIGLFPRHMHRVSHWKQTLDRLGIAAQCRSELSGEPAAKGTVIIWDTFGELNSAYAYAKAVFVGGSLAPLGGQNFLEPMIYGVTPIIGPSWENFAWVGEEIFHQGLAIRVKDWQEVASRLVRQLGQARSADPAQGAAAAYIDERKGGTRQACRLIAELLKTKRMNDSQAAKENAI